MTFKLGINTGFAVNRYAEPEVWTRIIGEELGLKYVQITADMLNPHLPKPIIQKYIDRIRKSCDQYGVQIVSAFTGAFTRVNHLAHPDEEIREYWVSWFKDFVDISAALGAKSLGGHFGIFTIQDNDDLEVRAIREKQNIEGWHRIGAHAKSKGMECLVWEPMSIRREQGDTLAEARRLQDLANQNAPLPFQICLDVDHGDVLSPLPADTDPYAWLATFAKDSPLIHVKQSTTDKGGHWPFIEPYNSKGKILPAKVLKTLRDNGRDEGLILLELSFRERNPADQTVVEVLKESVAYWRQEIKD